MTIQPMAVWSFYLSGALSYHVVNLSEFIHVVIINGLGNWCCRFSFLRCGRIDFNVTITHFIVIVIVVSYVCRITCTTSCAILSSNETMLRAQDSTTLRFTLTSTGALTLVELELSILVLDLGV